MYVILFCVISIAYSILPFFNICCRNVFKLHNEEGGENGKINMTIEAWYDWHSIEDPGYQFQDSNGFKID